MNDKSEMKQNNEDQNLIPAIVQEDKTGEVLMLAYMNRESLIKSIETGKTWFWSRSRKKLWNKGETSGNFQTIKKIKYDCDEDTLLIIVDQKGNACHTGNKSCFYREMDINGKSDIGKEIDSMKFKSEKRGLPELKNFELLIELYDTIKDRIDNKTDSSYTYELHKKGIDEIIKKYGEESIEVILSAKHQDRSSFIYEVSDMIYHLFVLMAEKNIKLDDILDELRSRRK